MLNGGSLPASIFQQKIEPPAMELVQCASEVDTAGWKELRNVKDGFVIKYPPTFAAEESTAGQLLLRQTSAAENAVPATILFERMRGDIQQFANPSMQQGSWKIADRQTYALTTPYYSHPDDDRSMWAEYLFVRDFPLASTTSTQKHSYSIVRATIQMDAHAPEFALARQQGIVDVEQILTLPEKILSTYRFLTLDELAVERGNDE